MIFKNVLIRNSSLLSKAGEFFYASNFKFHTYPVVH